MKKLFTFCFVALFCAATGFSQEKPIRIGLKFGAPNLAGLSLEYVTPSLDGRLAAALDFSMISANSGDIGVTFSYIELGGNYYFLNEGKGLYGNFSFGRIGFKGTYSDPFYGDGEGKLGINLINLKIGAKWGNGFYFRPEIGYGILAGGAKVTAEYTDPITNTTIKQEEELPGYLGGGVVFNLGIGAAF